MHLSSSISRKVALTISKDADMRANEIHLVRAKLLLSDSKKVLALVVLRGVISSTDDRAGKHEIIYSIQSLAGAGSTQYLLLERLHECNGDSLADPVPEQTDDIPQRAWVFNTYNEAAYIMGIEWMLASRGDSA